MEETKKGKIWHKILIAAIVSMATVFIFLYSQESKIARYVGKDKMGGILIVLDVHSSDSDNANPKKLNSKPSTNKKLNFIIIHFHLNNSKVIGFSQIPGNLRIEANKNFTDIQSLFLQEPELALKELNRQLPLHLAFYYVLKADQFKGFIDFLGGIYLFHDKGIGLKTGLNHISGELLLDYWHQRIIAKGYQEHLEHYLISKDLVSSIIGNSFLKLRHMDTNMNLKKENKLVRHLFSEENGNLSFNDMVSLISFFSNQWKKLIFLQLPLNPVKIDNNYFYSIRKGDILKNSLNDYLMQLSGKDEIKGNQRKVFGLDRNRLSAMNKPLSIEVLNASGINKQAKRIRNILTKKDLNVVQFSNYPNEKIERSAILIRNFNSLNKWQQLEKVKKIIGFNFPVVFAIDMSLLSDLSIILGKDFYPKAVNYYKKRKIKD